MSPLLYLPCPQSLFHWALSSSYLIPFNFHNSFFKCRFCTGENKSLFTRGCRVMEDVIGSLAELAQKPSPNSHCSVYFFQGNGA